MTDQECFLAKIAEDEWDEVQRNVYADWLMEHDQPEESDRQRQVVPSMRWIKAVLQKINYDDPDEHGERIPGKLGHPHDYDELIEAGHAAVSGKGYCFGTTDAAEFFGYSSDSPKNRAEFFHHWSIVTGIPVGQDVVDKPDFRCAC